MRMKHKINIPLVVACLVAVGGANTSPASVAIPKEFCDYPLYKQLDSSSCTYSGGGGEYAS